VGWLVALGAWLLHVGAVSMASLSTVQAVNSGGLVFLAIVAERLFGFELGRRHARELVEVAVQLLHHARLERDPQRLAWMVSITAW
jgi:hypothetical protein